MPMPNPAQPPVEREFLMTIEINPLSSSCTKWCAECGDTVFKVVDAWNDQFGAAMILYRDGYGGRSFSTDEFEITQTKA